jgi:predicted PurR-regulated permease PerM
MLILLVILSIIAVAIAIYFPIVITKLQKHNDNIEKLLCESEKEIIFLRQYIRKLEIEAEKHQIQIHDIFRGEYWE